jgi:hypothetical protein
MDRFVGRTSSGESETARRAKEQQVKARVVMREIGPS